MTNEYRIEIVGGQFIVVDPWDEIVDRCSTEEAALEEIERCKQSDAKYETARLLVDNAVKAFMQLHGVDRDAAERAIRDAMGGA